MERWRSVATHLLVEGGDEVLRDGLPTPPAPRPKLTEVALLAVGGLASLVEALVTQLQYQEI